MNWSPQQNKALSSVHDWLNYGEQRVYRLFGYAGTGKTTLAKHFAAGVKGTVLFAAYTGKAAHVLRQKGCPGAATIHSLIYHPKEKGRAHLAKLELDLVNMLTKLTQEETSWNEDVKRLRKEIKVEREALAQPLFTLNPDSTVASAKLVVIDECSMVDDRMGQDLLLSFGTKVLVLGDPAQLPPVRGSGFFTEGVEPDIMLDEIHRQAADNPIIRLATQARQQQELEPGVYGDSEVTNRRLEPDEVLAANQVLVGRNITRKSCNDRLRSLLGRHEDPLNMNNLPVARDRLVCLRNNHDLGLLNGAIWYVSEIDEYDLDNDRILMSLVSEYDNLPVQVEAHTYPFTGGGDPPGWWERKDSNEFDYGYALTVHKAQGSQWDNVVLFDESWCFRKDRWRWLYTGLTRAANKVTVVRL